MIVKHYNIILLFSQQANSLHWGCLTALPDVYNTPLWKCLCDTLDIIAEGVRVTIYNYIVDKLGFCSVMY